MPPIDTSTKFVKVITVFKNYHLMKNNYQTQNNTCLRSYFGIKKLLFTLLILIASNSAFSQVTITKPNLAIGVCTGYP